jgi:hypothetical protein
MPDLGEYLGHLLCEVTRARVMADNEAIRFARQYASEETGLLRHFPVPRMRLPEVEISVPVVVLAVPDGYAEVATTEPPQLARLLVDALGPALAGEGVRLDVAEVTRIIREDPLLSGGRLEDDAVNALTAGILEQARATEERQPTARRPSSPRERARATSDFVRVTALIREQVAKVLAAVPRRRAGVAVDGRTASVKEVGNTAVPLNVKLVIREDALEILLAEQPANGETSGAPTIARLVPE